MPSEVGHPSKSKLDSFKFILKGNGNMSPMVLLLGHIIDNVFFLLMS